MANVRKFDNEATRFAFIKILVTKGMGKQIAFSRVGEVAMELAEWAHEHANDDHDNISPTQRIALLEAEVASLRIKERIRCAQGIGIESRPEVERAAEDATDSLLYRAMFGDTEGRN